MNPKQGASSAWCGTWMVCLTALLLLGPTRVEGGVKVVDQEDFSLELGLRMQPRLVYVPIPTRGGGSEWERTFLVRRTRFKMNGRMLSAKYGFEWRLDGTGLSSGVVQSTPIAGVENAWIQWPLAGSALQVDGFFSVWFHRMRPLQAQRAGWRNRPTGKDSVMLSLRKLAPDASSHAQAASLTRPPRSRQMSSARKAHAASEEKRPPTTASERLQLQGVTIRILPLKALEST